MLSVGEPLAPGRVRVGQLSGELRKLREQVLQLLLDLVRQLVRVDAGRQDLLEVLLLLRRLGLRLLLLLGAPVPARRSAARRWCAAHRPGLQIDGASDPRGRRSGRSG